MRMEDSENRRKTDSNLTRNAITLFLLINELINQKKTILLFKYIILKFLKSVIRLTIVAKQTQF